MPPPDWPGRGTREKPTGRAAGRRARHVREAGPTQPRPPSSLPVAADISPERPWPGSPRPRPDVAMSALAPRLLGGLTPRGPLRLPRAALHARPAREELSLVEKTAAMAVCFVSLLVPSGWVLAHLGSYKKKE
ncbi:cytochrome c oxidase subunit 8A, mitochondrial [Macrotis lagotis]|uniref:cytochrome c oxidase subunit 8A, mitochondrial n=1 Tax=Macrotis lagotis TaxID=92651 RepID=UPI003D68D8E1